MVKNKKIKKVHFGLLFFIGLSLFIFGIIGYIFRLFMWVPVDIDEVLPTNTVFLTEIQLGKIQETSDVFNLTEFRNRLDLYLANRFNINFTETIKPWVGKTMSFAMLDDGTQIWALKYRNKKAAQHFLQNFTIENEHFITKQYNEGELLTPEFSSNITFGFYHNWLLISTQKTSIAQLFTKTEALNTNKQYRKIKTDLPVKNFIFLFSDNAKVLEHTKLSQDYLKYKPLLTTLTKSLSVIGITLQKDNNNIVLNTKILTADGIFDDQKIPKTPNENMPKLASLVPDDVLFFTNGENLYGKYLHTKAFLNTLEPQFAIIFEGLLKAQFEQVFGESFNFESDFLEKMRGQYALFLNIEDPAKPFVNFSFISDFSDQDETQLQQIEKAIQKAQAQHTTITEKVKLPDGSVREELVSAQSTNALFTENTFENQTYFSSPEKDNKQSFAYGIIDHKFVFSTHDSGIKSVIMVTQGKKQNLTQNKDFRESLLFKFSPSQSYGFLNFIKLNILTNLWEKTSDYDVIPFIISKFKDMTFARKIFPGEIFIKIILFQ